MSFFDDRDGILHAEDVPLREIADAVGTPVHVYSARALRHAADGFRAALRHLPSARFAFAVKATRFDRHVRSYIRKLIKMKKTNDGFQKTGRYQ